MRGVELLVGSESAGLSGTLGRVCYLLWHGTASWALGLDALRSLATQAVPAPVTKAAEKPPEPADPPGGGLFGGDYDSD